MAVTLRSSVAANVFGAAASATWPATVDTDVALACLITDSDSGNGDGATPTAPAGWVQTFDSFLTGTWRPRVTVWQYECDGTETGNTGDFDAIGGSDSMSFSVTVWAGGLVPDVIGVAADGFDAAPSASSITTVADGAMLVAFAGAGGNPSGYTPPSGYAEAVDTGNGTNYRAQSVAYKIQASAGASGAAAFALPGSDNWQAVLLSIPPAGLSVTLPHITRSRPIRTLTVTQGAQTVTLPFLFPTTGRGNWGDVWDDTWGAGYSNRTIHDLAVTLGTTDVTLPHIVRGRTIHPLVVTPAGGPQSVTLPHIVRARTIYPPEVQVVKNVTLPHITRGGYGNYQVGYGDSRIGILTVTVADPSAWLFIPPDSATQKSPTVTAEFHRNHPISIFHRMPAKPRQVHVLKEDGVYTNYEIITTQQTQDADVVYLGGHRYEVDADEAAALVAAGYTVTAVP
ncbi:MAG: hypothetical protein GY925_17805 [Actinomycetia bacterium]|nr:hypothetical protein [Actinomycetes bacterium]